MKSADAVPRAPREWVRASAAGLAFRLIANADLPFLFAVYVSARAEELAPLPWTDAQKTAFLTQQFQAQHVDYQRNYPGADWLVIMRAGNGAGRLYLDRNACEHSVIDIALLPEHRRQGLGGALMRDLQDDAAAAGKPLSIYVEKFNPAMRLYRRLGFETVEDKGVYDLMRWVSQVR